MSIATQLKRLETAFSPSSDQALGMAALNAEDNDTLKKVFSLAPAAFVDAWAQALALDDREFTASDREIFVRAAQGGSSRLKIVDALYARKWLTRSPLSMVTSHDICRTQDHLVLIENLERHTPEDNAAFARFAFRQICARDPTPVELLSYDFDLRRGAIDRRAAIKKIVRTANLEGVPALWDSLDLEEAKDDPTCARTLPSGFGYDEEGRESLIFVRQLPQGGWIVAPDIMQQSPKIEERGWLVEEGWLVTGPKRSLRPGVWRVDLNILQDEHVLSMDLVANSGLDVLQQITIHGSFSGSFCVEISSQHRFVELRLLSRSGAAWINPRNISMHRMS